MDAYRQHGRVQSLSDVELVSGIAQVIRGTRCAWAPVSGVCQVLQVSRRNLLESVMSSKFCTHVNGYLRAKTLEQMLAPTKVYLGNAPREMLALAVAMTSDTDPFIPQQVLVNAGWNRYRLPAFRSGMWLQCLLDLGYLEQHGAFLLVTSRVDDAEVATDIIAAFDLR